MIIIVFSTLQELAVEASVFCMSAVVFLSKMSGICADVHVSCCAVLCCAEVSGVNIAADAGRPMCLILPTREVLQRDRFTGSSHPPNNAAQGSTELTDSYCKYWTVYMIRCLFLRVL